tara:strand:+ start:54 stop:422 length:369 start_codon:yes stop_codon:yes gene_type:complete
MRDTPNYKTNDPKGWCGDPSRGAAMGRPTIKNGDPATAIGLFTLRPVAIEDGYDSSGTYFGVGQPLFWCAYQNEGTGHDIDFVFRAFGWGDAKAYVLHEYPAAEFEEFKDVDAFWRNYPIFD